MATDAQATSAKTPLLMLMDGHAMVHRAWHAIQQPLTVRRTGEQVQGVLGFLNTFLWALGDLEPTHCAITFDLPKPTFRHKEYDEYKAHRPSSPPELRAQFPHVRKIMQAFGVPILEHEGYEADDVLGTLGRQAEEKHLDTVILTGDTDELQLVSSRVKVLMSFSRQGRTMYDVPKVKERYGGLGPEAIADLKALQGDSSDNIPGVPGIGMKTAIKLLNQYHSIHGIYGHLDEIQPPRIQQSLRENHELA
ncbi:MAG: 5'-3' exonuclease H3TH domain-containing protein, partial [SAR202 cluster bacterium]|nr:5'-3' exonuclease H3TH domain-containing protein [SAR202 cluster bacterium]